MNLPSNLTSILSVLSIVLSIAGLIIAPATAADATTIPVAGQGQPGHGFHHAMNATAQAEHLQAILTTLGSQGVDVSQPQSDIAAGNATAAMQWLFAYHKDHPGMMGNETRPQFGNVTARTEMLQTMLTTLGSQGVDVSQPQSDIAAGNATAAMQWLFAYHKDHPGMMGNETRPQFGNVTARTEMLQTMLTKLGSQGVDVSQPQSDIAAGNMTAAMQWLFAYHKDHPGMTGNETRPQFGNATAQAEHLQAMLTKLGSQGVDVSQPQSDISAGNMTAAMQWLFAYHKDHATTAFNQTGKQQGSWFGFPMMGNHTMGGRATGNTTWSHHARFQPSNGSQ